jgi:signal transduction histidine kinase
MTDLVRETQSAPSVGERRLEAAFGWTPYVALVLAAVLTLVMTDDTWRDRAVTLGLAAVAAAWVFVMYTRAGPAARTRQSRMRLYFIGLMAIAAVAMVHGPFFFIFAITGFFHVNVLRPWAVTVAGVGATSLVVNGLIPGFPNPTPDGLVVYAVVVVVQTAAVSIGIVGGEKLTELSEERRQAVAELQATLAENAGLHAQLVEQAREAGVLDERQRLAREIHDTLAQGLTGVITQVEAAMQASDRPTERQRHLDNAARLARESLGEARRSVQALGPAALEDERLPEAIAGVAERWSALSEVPVQLATTGTVQRLHPEIEITVLRVAQEALANVARHAHASRVGVTLSYMGDLVTLDVRDDGVGFLTPPGTNGRDGGNGADPSMGYGLTAMRQRVERLGGRLAVESEPGRGTAVSASIPVVVDRLPR